MVAEAAVITSACFWGYHASLTQIIRSNKKAGGLTLSSGKPVPSCVALYNGNGTTRVLIPSFVEALCEQRRRRRALHNVTFVSRSKGSLLRRRRLSLL
jgi:hypothetical protein